MATGLHRCRNLADFRTAARRILPHGIFEFIDRGVEDERAIAHNRAALDRIRFRPRVMVDVSGRSAATELFGLPIGMPVVLAPTGAAGLCCFEGELALAQAAAAANIPFTLTAASFTPMEQIAARAGGRLWFQFYMPQEPSLARGLIQRALAAGVEALVVTVDTPISPNREHNPRNGFYMPFRFSARFVLDVMLHPRWLLGVMGRYVFGPGVPHFENYPDGLRRSILSRDAGARQRNDGITWAHLRQMRKEWPRTLIVKGILRADDALAAIDAGAEAIVVSNHGGRNLDATEAPIDVLAEIAAAVGHRAAVLVDSGFLRGSDIVKALALGARAVMLGRPALYASAVGGRAGVAHMLDLLHSEIERIQAGIGCPRIADIGPDALANMAARGGAHETSAVHSLRARTVP